MVYNVACGTTYDVASHVICGLSTITFLHCLYIQLMYTKRPPRPLALILLAWHSQLCFTSKMLWHIFLFFLLLSETFIFRYQIDFPFPDFNKTTRLVINFAAQVTGCGEACPFTENNLNEEEHGSFHIKIKRPQQRRLLKQSNYLPVRINSREKHLCS